MVPRCLSLFSLFLLFGATFFAAPGIADPPNFVVIMADDLGAKELGCYGHPDHRTPNLDRLAETGVQFDTAYTCPVCHPTRFPYYDREVWPPHGRLQLRRKTRRSSGSRPRDRHDYSASHLLEVPRFGGVCDLLGREVAAFRRVTQPHFRMRVRRIPHVGIRAVLLGGRSRSSRRSGNSIPFALLAPEHPGKRKVATHGGRPTTGRTCSPTTRSISSNATRTSHSSFITRWS